jgi:hypothetical protein
MGGSTHETLGRTARIAALSLACLSTAGLTAAQAAVAKSYKNCTSLNRVYPHGVGTSGARDRVGGSTKPVTNFKVSTTIYNLNNGPHKSGTTKDYDLDRDTTALPVRSVTFR